MDHPRKASRRGGRFARRLRQEASPGEKLLWWALRNRRFRFKFRRQHPVGGYVLDFYCAERRLCVEIDGATHDHPDAQRRDDARSRFLERERIRVIRFSERDVVTNLPGVIAAIEQELIP